MKAEDLWRMKSETCSFYQHFRLADVLSCFGRRPLPEGWVRQLDPNTGHHFYVDTKANPPKSIWQHPYDDPSVWQHPGDSGARQGQQQQQQRPAAAERTNTSEKQSLGIRIKDKLSMSHQALLR